MKQLNDSGVLIAKMVNEDKFLRIRRYAFGLVIPLLPHPSIIRSRRSQALLSFSSLEPMERLAMPFVKCLVRRTAKFTESSPGFDELQIQRAGETSSGTFGGIVFGGR